MATALVIGSLVASAGSAVAGTSAAMGAGIVAAKFAAVSAGLGAAATVKSTLDARKAASAQSKSIELASEHTARELEIQTEAEKAQNAIEDAERERQLRVTLASQEAAFAGGGADPFSGSPVRINQDTQSISNRAGRRAGFVSGLRISALGAKKGQELRSGRARAKGVKAKSKASTLRAFTSVAQQGLRSSSLIKGS